MLFGLRFEPDGVAVGEEIVVGFFFGDDAAADRDDSAVAFGKDALESALLNGAIAGLRVEGENFGKGHAGFFFDFVVELNEGDVALGGELGAKGGFAGAAQADEGDATEAKILLRAEVAQEASGGFFEAMAGEALDEAQDGLLLRSMPLVVLLSVLVLWGEQFFERDAQHGGDSAKKQDGDVAFAGFELGKVALGDVGFAGKSFSGHAAAVAKIADAGAEGEEKLLAGKLRRAAEKELGFELGVRCHGWSLWCSIVHIWTVRSIGILGGSTGYTDVSTN